MKATTTKDVVTTSHRTESVCDIEVELRRTPYAQILSIIQQYGTVVHNVRQTVEETNRIERAPSGKEDSAVQSFRSQPLAGAGMAEIDVEGTRSAALSNAW